MPRKSMSMEDLADKLIRPTVVLAHDALKHLDHQVNAAASKCDPEIGMRHDKGKVKLDLLPPELEEALAKMMQEGLRVDLVPLEAIRALAVILTEGAKKYAPRNWEKGLMYRSTFASLRRHLLAWRKGTKLDEELNIPVLYGALFGVAALITFEERGMSDKLDDFPLGKEPNNDT